MKLSRREAQVLHFINETIAASGKPPFQYEIAAHLGTESRGFVWRILKRLEEKGAIRRRIYEIRGIETIGGPRQTKEQRDEIVQLYLSNPEEATRQAISRGLSPAYAYKLASERGLIPRKNEPDHVAVPPFVRECLSA